jgi:FHA domain
MEWRLTPRASPQGTVPRGAARRDGSLLLARRSEPTRPSPRAGRGAAVRSPVGKGQFLGNAQTHVGVEVGDGLVARFGDALVLVAEVSQHREQAEELLGAVESAASGTAPPGPLIATRLAAIIANVEPGSIPSFGVVAPLDDGYVVLLHGKVSAEITGAPGVLRLSGEQAVTWVDQRVEVPVERLAMSCRQHPVKVDPMSDLRAGIVPGSGFVLTPAGSAASHNPSETTSTQAGPHTTQASEAPPTRGEAFVGDDPTMAQTADGQLAEGQLADGEPPKAGPASFEAAAAGPVAAVAVDAGAAAVAQIAQGSLAGIDGEETAPQPAAHSTGARSTEALAAPVGYLVSSDGTRIPLDRDYVLGREPEADAAVRIGVATPVRLPDDDNLISRVHSYIAVEGREVSLRDASSANGTFMAAPGDDAWAQVGTDPVVLAPTWSVRVGNRVFTYVTAEPV